jgi:hypothetical protein
MGISNRSPAKNLVHFLQAIWLIGNDIFSENFQIPLINGSELPAFLACKHAAKHAALTRPGPYSCPD